MKKEDLIEFAKTVPENTLAVITTRTTVKMNKKDVKTKTIPNPFSDIYKVAKVKVLLNANYEKLVNDSRAKEGKPTDFVAEAMKYGTMIGNALLENKGQLYLKCIEKDRVGDSKYENAISEPIDYNELLPFIPEYTGSVKQDLENEVKVRNYKIESVIDFEVVEN